MTDLWPPIITTAGALVGSFGGYLLAARAQLRAEERKDARDRDNASLDRIIFLEDERHEFQLKTLLALQELVRQMARSTYLVIEQDRKTVEQFGEYRTLPASVDETEFEASIEFSHSAARVTSDPLREELESLKAFCTAVTLPPPNHASLSKPEVLALQGRRYAELASRVDVLNKMLGECLRAELDRNLGA